ncbi:metallophosphoesterase [Paracoccaceae bacterium]
MTRLLHLSDLHFGRERPELLGPLVALAQELRPDVTVISGDLTQRARPAQFRASAALIAQLPGPVLCTPGNHDMPLWNPVARLVRPFTRWRRFVGDELEPMVEVSGLRVICLNTADPLAWQRGLVREAGLARVCARLRAAAPGQLRVVALHHPLHLPAASSKAPMKGADTAAAALAGARADVILCGHLHQWAAAPYALREGGRAMLAVQAGTTLSTRLRGEENDLNLITHEAGRITVTRYAARGATTTFTPHPPPQLCHGSLTRGWQLALDPSVPSARQQGPGL